MLRAFAIVRRSGLLAAGVLVLVVAPAYAAGGHGGPPLVLADFLGIGHLAGSVFGTIGHALLGAFSWTFQLAANFILTTIGAVVKLLIPRSWAKQGVQIMRWIVAVPDYAGTITGPTGQHSYGFAGINALRDLFTWIGAGLLPLTLVYATSRAMVGHGDHVAIPLVRVLSLAALLISYPYWWEQAAALINQMTDMVLSLAPVVSGLRKLMLYAVDGVGLGGWQLIDLGLMAAIAIELLALIFLKVAIILLGALLYATGPITVGLVPTDSGATITRAWCSAVGMQLILPVAWAAVFAVGALLINDAGTAGPLIAGNSDIGTLFGGVLLAITGLASLWLCLRAAREAGGLLRVQLGGMLALSRAPRGTTGTSTVAVGGGSGAQSLRGFTRRVSEAGGAAAGAMASSGQAGARLAHAGSMAAGVGRRGVLGTAAAGARSGAAQAAPGAAMLIGRLRAGAVAVQMARAGTASWQNTAQRTTRSAGGGASGAESASARAASNAMPAAATGAAAGGASLAGAASARAEGVPGSGPVPMPARPSAGQPARAEEPGSAPAADGSTRRTAAPTPPPSARSKPPPGGARPRNDGPRKKG
jgi:hypothetical protein